MGTRTLGTTTDSDEALLAATQQGDEGALSALYDRYGGLAFGLAYRILDDPNEAEDAVQDAFMDVWQRTVRYDTGRGPVRTWLLSIVHHRVRERLRDLTRLVQFEPSGADLELARAGEYTWDQVAGRMRREEGRPYHQSRSAQARREAENIARGIIDDSDLDRLLLPPLRGRFIFWDGAALEVSAQDRRRLSEMGKQRALAWLNRHSADARIALNHAWATVTEE